MRTITLFTPEVTEFNPKNPKHQVAAARSLVETGDYYRALKLLGPVAHQPELAEDIEFLRLYGRVCLETNKPVIAQEVLSKALKIEEKNGKSKKENRTIKTALLYAEVLKKISKNLYVDFLEKAICFQGTDEEKTTVYEDLAQVFLEDMVDPTNFFKINENIAHKDPSVSGESTVARANFYEMWGRAKDAENVFKKEIRDFPANTLGLQNLYKRFGEFLENRGEWENALEKFSKAIEYANKEEAIALVLHIASIYWNPLENRKEAINQLKKAVETYGNDEALLKQLAIYYQAEGDLTSAIRSRKQRMENAPWDRLAEINTIAEMSAQLGISTIEDYEKLLQKEINNSPQSYLNYLALGSLYEHNKKFQEAVDIYEKGTSKCDSPEAHEEITNALGRLKLYPGAIDLAIETLKKPVFKKIPRAYLSLSGLYVRKRDWQQGLEYAKKYMAVVPVTGLTAAVIRTAELLRRTENTAEAFELLQGKMSEQPENVLLHQAFLEALRCTGKFNEALKELDKLEKKTGDYYSEYLLEKRVRLWAENLNNIDKAQEIIENTSEENMGSQGLLYKAAMCWEIIGDFAKAREIWQTFKFYGNEEMQKLSIIMLVKNLFLSGFYEESLLEGQNFEEIYGKDINVLFFMLQCKEALGQPVENLVKEMQDYYIYKKAIDCDRDDFRKIFRLALRDKTQLKRAEELVGWIDDMDIPIVSTKLRSCEALYYLCTGRKEEGVALLRRLLKFGFFDHWLSRFLHDMNILCEEYKIDLPRGKNIFNL